MNTNKAAYWIAVGALALGLNSEHRHRNFTELHRIADRAGSALCQIAARAENTLAVAKLLASPDAGLPDTLVATADEGRMAGTRAEMHREQSRSREETELYRDEVRDRARDEIRAQAGVIRGRAEMRRAEMEIQYRTRSQFKFADAINREVSVFCPKARTRTRIVLNQLGLGSPVIEVGETSRPE
jgi:hypothetical protein